MKKLVAITLVVSGTLFIPVCYGQKGFVFDDAVEVLKGKPEDVNKIIAHYSSKTDSSQKDINKIIQENPFLKRSIILHNMTNKAVPGTVGVPTGTGSGLFGLNVTNFADGLAKFLIERGKQELSMAFFDKMKEEFKKYPELKTLFPLTLEILEQIQNHNILTLLQELRDAFVKDLLNGPSNVLALRQLNTLAACSELTGAEKTKCDGRIRAIKKAAATRSAATSLLVAQGILTGGNIISIMGTVVTDTTFCKGNSEGKDQLGGYLKFTYVLMDMLRNSSDADGLFIDEVGLKELFSNEELLIIFLGLGYERYNTMDCFRPDQLKIGNATLETMFEAVLDKRTQFHGLLSSFDNVNFAYAG